jgi:molybdopterin-guanine dinucleotide biosynthesis protein A
MGQDKAFLVCEGRRLLDRQLAALGAVHPRELLVSGRGGTDYGVTEAKIVWDVEPDQGPLGGIAALLEATLLPHLLVLAVDMPLMTTEFLAAMVEQCGPQRGVVPQTAAGWEPLAAVYPREILPRVRAHLAAGKRSVCRLVDEAWAAGEVAPWEVQPLQECLFANWNRPEDLGQRAVR